MELLARSIALLLVVRAPVATVEPVPRVRELRILILSTMLADAGIGEWGFAALVEADGQRILFDTGARPETVLQNAREMSVDLSGVRRTRAVLQCMGARRSTPS